MVSKEFTKKKILVSCNTLYLDGEKVSLVDFNRSGVPLVEIVSKPDMSSSEEAKEYLKKIHEIIRAFQGCLAPRHGQRANETRAHSKRQNRKRW